MKSIVLTNLKINQGIEYIVKNFLFSHDKSCSYLSLQCYACLWHDAQQSHEIFSVLWYSWLGCGNYQTDVVFDLSAENYLLHAQNFVMV